MSPESFYTETAAEIDTFVGVAESTMYRDDGWRFIQIGRLIERAQLSTALLLTQLAACAEVGESCRELHHLVTAAYFDYPVEDASAC